MVKGKTEKIKTPAIKIDGNVISYGNAFICTDNISFISISKIAANMSWIIAVLLGVAGLFFAQESEIGFLALAVAVIWLIIVYIYNINRGENLAINLNSGVTLYFNCKDKEFLKKVVDLILKNIKEGNRSKYNINFDKCTINGNVFSNANLD